MAARERSNSFLSKPDASVGLMETLSSSLPARKSQSARDEEDKLKKMAKACATLLECPYSAHHPPHAHPLRSLLWLM